ncbi:hypothetical protein CAPTEDRAFT_201430 [Capitella teleta]|uniref:2-oxoglutarate dehydrogenase E1 component N-terminal domain-containing protein n=1 Tax=Capitella teleta TaxID=283909 RepID=R7T4A0_CAPTE|nr:hypothetical protein CAPTEDRAFT_201430 [Capitella teleta]|eukprot:ELT87678.1 hypothetical protein CAPTEDRAFT_201430 [Capitella teleta]
MHRLRTFVQRSGPIGSAALKTWSQQRSATQKLLLSQKSGQLGMIRPQHSSSVTAEPFLNGSSSQYVEEMYNAWQDDPSSVHKVSLAKGPISSYVESVFVSVAFVCTGKKGSKRCHDLLMSYERPEKK